MRFSDIHIKILIFKQESFLEYTKILIPGPQLGFFGYTVFVLVMWPAPTSQRSKGVEKELGDLGLCSECLQWE